MAPPSPKPSGGGLGKRLTRKVGPLPVWAWAAVVLGAYYLWSRTRSSSSATTDTASTSATTSTDSSGAQVPASGQGSSADNMSGVLLDQLSANTSSLDALTSQLLSMPTPYSNYGDAPAAGTPPPATTAPPPTAPASQPTTPPVTAPAAGAPPAQHQTQTTAGSLKWGGLTFTTRAAFDSWAKAHGSSTTAELRNHPQAKAIYSTLK